MNPVARAFAAVGVAELLTPGSAEMVVVKRYIDGLDVSPEALARYNKGEPNEELAGLDVCLEQMTKVHPNVGKAGTLRADIMSRIHPDTFAYHGDGSPRVKPPKAKPGEKPESPVAVSCELMAARSRAKVHNTPPLPLRAPGVPPKEMGGTDEDNGND